MRKPLSLLVVAGLVCLAPFVGAAALQAPASQASEPSVEDVVTAVRADMQDSRADVMAKNLTLSAEQAAKFWPLFNQYQQQQNEIMDEQLKGIESYINNYSNLDDAGALALIKAHFDRDERMNALRRRWLGAFQKILPTKTAVRVMQIDRRLSLVSQTQMVTLIPLAH
jgi:Spy/CpxP family protein refolding chaperone